MVCRRRRVSRLSVAIRPNGQTAVAAKEFPRYTAVKRPVLASVTAVQRLVCGLTRDGYGLTYANEAVAMPYISEPVGTKDTSDTAIRR